MKNKIGVIICGKNIKLLKLENWRLNLEGVQFYVYSDICTNNCQNFSEELNEIFCKCVIDNREIIFICGEKCYKQINNYYSLEGLNYKKLSTCYYDYNILLQKKKMCPQENFENHPDSLKIAEDYVRTTIENIIMERNTEKSIMIANQKIADYAMFCDLISELNNKSSEKEAAEGIMSLFSMLFGGKGFIYISLNKNGKINFVDHYAILKKDVEKEINELIKFDKDYLWNDAEESVTIKIKSNGQALGIFKILGIKSSNYREYFLNFSITIGKVCGMVVSNARNYEKLKKSQLDLYEEKKKLSDIFDSMSEMVVVSDKQQKIIFINKAVLKAANTPDMTEITGRRLTDFILPDYACLTNRWSEETILNHNKVSPEEIKLLKTNGGFWDVEVSCSPIKFNQDSNMLIIIRDITEKKQNEELHRKVEEKSKQLLKVMEGEKLRTEFFANFSHELRTPLNVISGTLQLIELLLNNSSIKTDKVKLINYNKIMKQNCFRLIRIVNNLIDVSKIDANYYKLNMTNENIVDVVENIVQQSACFLKDKGLKVIFDTDVEEKIMTFDIDAVEKIILNLISNSVKFTRKGGTINVNIIDGDEYIQIIVRDTGIGIPKEKQKSIFERFTRVDKSFSRKQEGIGIGLFIVKSLVDLHNGEISLKSKWRVGSEFTVKIPCRLLENENVNTSNNYIRMSCAQKVKTEFSDIYFQ